MPGIQTREKIIGDCTYRVTQLGTIRGQAVLLTLARPIGAAVNGLTGFDIGAALRALSEQDLSNIANSFAESTRVLVPDDPELAIEAGEKPNPPKWHPLPRIYDAHFAGRWGAWMQWLTFAVEVNFGDFFGDLVAKLPREGAARRSTSTPTLTGSSGVSSSPNA